MTVRVSVIGLGNMGGAVAERLLESGFETRVYDVDRGKIDRLVHKGAISASQEDLADCEFLITSLPDDAIVSATVVGSGLLERLAGAVLIELSTILPRTLLEIAEQGARHGVTVVDSPVSGGPGEARSGKLTLLVGADDSALARARPVLDTVGTIEHVGPAGHGKAIKLVNNVMSMGNVVVAAEAFVLGAKLGLDRRRMFDVLSRSGGRSHHFVKRIPYALERDFSARFPLMMAEKDLRLALELAHEESYVMPVTSIAHQMYELGRAKGLEGEDQIAVIKLYEDMLNGSDDGRS